jgi:hypothetical protein
VPHGVGSTGPQKAAWHAQARRDALGSSADDQLVRWEDAKLPPLKLQVLLVSALFLFNLSSSFIFVLVSYL